MFSLSYKNIEIYNLDWLWGVHCQREYTPGHLGLYVWQDTVENPIWSIYELEWGQLSHLPNELLVKDLLDFVDRHSSYLLHWWLEIFL